MVVKDDDELRVVQGFAGDIVSPLLGLAHGNRWRLDDGNC